MTDWYAPNQQAVRADESGPAEEGSGGAGPPPESQPEPESEPLPVAEQAEDSGEEEEAS